MGVLNYNLNDNDKAGAAGSAKFGIDKNKILGGKDTKTGWKVFKSEYSSPSYGTYTNLYIATIFTLSQKNNYTAFLEALERNSQNSVFFKSANIGGTFDFSVDEYSVFSFALEGKERALNTIHVEHKKVLAKKIFKALLKVIYAHSTSPMCAERYVPLNIINEDNIYLCQDGERVRIKILPMPVRNVSDDIRRSRNTGNTDVSIDLFDAVYLYMQLRYPGDEQIPERRTGDLFLERCLLPILKRRPSFETVLKTFEIDVESSPMFNYQDDIRRTPYEYEAYSQNNDVDDETHETNMHEDPDGDHHDAENRNNLGDQVSKVVDVARDKISEGMKGFIEKLVKKDTPEDKKNDGTVE